MSRRNFTNDRNTLPDKKTGTTRKSASSAKPARAAAGSVYVTNTKKTKQELKDEERRKQREERRIEEIIQEKVGKVDTAKIKKLRAVWIVTLAGAIICTILAWFARNFMPEAASIAVMVLAYVFIIAALVVDLVFIRKERKRGEQATLEAMSSKGAKSKIYSEAKRQARAEIREEERAAKEKAKAEAKEKAESEGASKK